MEIIVPALLKLISVLKSKPTEDQGTPPGRQNWKRGACWLKGSNRQLRPSRLQTAQEITEWKDFFLFYLLQLCLEQFRHSLPSAGCYRPSDERWNGSCSAPALRQPRLGWFGLNCCCCWRWFTASQRAAEKEAVMLLSHLSHLCLQRGRVTS